MMDALAESAEQRDWQALPEGVLQHVCYRASSSQTPGTCVAAPMCRSWRSAAAGCSRLQLLYHVGHKTADQSFIIWLERNSGQLGALTLSSSKRFTLVPNSKPVVTALVEAAAAAQAAGRPLRLQTLRVLGDTFPVHTAGQLLAALPHLRCLQLGVEWHSGTGPTWSGSNELREALAPLQHATQLEELYVEGLYGDSFTVPINELLPPSVKRLSWGIKSSAGQDLSDLNKCTFLRLFSCQRLHSNQLPPRLQQLELTGSGVSLEVVEEQREVVTSWTAFDLGSKDVQQLLTRLPKLAAVTLESRQLQNAAALKQASKLSMLTVHGSDVFTLSPENELRKLQPAVAMAAGLRNLRCLHVRAQFLPEVPLGLSALKQLTQLRVSIGRTDIVEPQQCSWVQEVSHLQGLQRLSLPNVFLHEQQDWLGELQQLRVLVLKCMDAYLLASPLMAATPG